MVHSFFSSSSSKFLFKANVQHVINSLAEKFNHLGRVLSTVTVQTLNSLSMALEKMLLVKKGVLVR